MQAGAVFSPNSLHFGFRWKERLTGVSYVRKEGTTFDGIFQIDGAVVLFLIRGGAKDKNALSRPWNGDLRHKKTSKTNPGGLERKTRLSCAPLKEAQNQSFGLERKPCHKWRWHKESVFWRDTQLKLKDLGVFEAVIDGGLEVKSHPSALGYWGNLVISLEISFIFAKRKLN